MGCITDFSAGCLPGRDLRPAGLLGVRSWRRWRHMLCIPRHDAARILSDSVLRPRLVRQAA
jgi:hypothetical protein